MAMVNADVTPDSAPSGPLSAPDEGDLIRWRFVGAIIPAAALIIGLGARAAYGVPSFARQTQMACDACHAGGFFPELTDFGRMFKMNGYVWSAHEEEPYEPYPPVAAEQTWSYTHTAKGQPGLRNLPTVHFTSSGNNNFSYPQQASFFLAGRYYGRLGGFIQGTYDGADNRWATDNVDIRLTDVRAVGEHHTLVYGATLNNNPTVQDVWNTLPAWNQLIASEVAPTPAASPSIASLGAQVGGVGAYAFWDNFLYAEVTPYLSGKSGVLSFLTTGNPKTTVTAGPSPYWRLVLYKNKGDHSISLGHVGLYDKTFETGSSGPTNSFLDLGGDLQYQWNRKPHFVTFRSMFIWENQGLSAAKAAKTATHAFDDLRTEQFWVSYYYYMRVGITLSLFNIAGSRDPKLYAPAPVGGSRTGSPNTLGGFVQLNALPFAQWLNLKWPTLPMTQLALQYTFYGKFNGAGANYDGSGRQASDNNTLYLLVWSPW
jgi:hypothetical protein